MRRIGIAVFSIVVAGAVSAGPAMALTNRDAQNCAQQADVDRQITGCTRMIEAKSLSSQQRMIAYANRCLAFGVKNLHERALADCDQAKRMAPRQPLIYNNAALVWGYRGDLDRAMVEFNEAIRIDPKSATSFANRGSLWDDKGQYDRAIADLNEAARLEPKTAGIYNVRSIVWRHMGEYDRSIEDASQAIRLDPKSSLAYANRGTAWRSKGDLDRALIDQDKALQIDPKSAINHVKRGDTHRYKGDSDRAFADYDRALRLAPGYIAALVGRGLTYEKMGDHARARTEFENATTSPHPLKGGIALSALETARARLAAFDSGAAQPIIPAAPSKAAMATSVPTPALTLPAALPTALKQGRRVALVIGNSAYKSVPALANPQRDADAVAKSLRATGFDTVTLASDASREKLVDALRIFANEAEKADWAVVYYAGHGIEVNGVNYMVPVDAKLAADRDVQFEAVPLDQVMASVEGAKKLKLVLLDACRDNPFAPQMRKTVVPAAVAASSTAGGAVGTRSVGRGLGEVKVSGATLVVYAAKHGQTALDGEGGNSPFAVAVVQRLATPNVEINKLFRLVRDDVMEATAGRQEPYTYGSLPGREDFFFVQR